MNSAAIAKLKAGTLGKLTHFTNDHIAGKLMSMGALPGSIVEIIRVAPFRGGYYLKIDGNCIAIRKQEAENIFLSV